MKLQINRLTLSLQGSAGVDARRLGQSVAQELASGVSQISSAPEQKLRVNVTTHEQTTPGLSREIARQISRVLARRG